MQQSINLVEALKQESNKTYTANGAVTHRSSLNSCVDFFFQASTADLDKALKLFRQAYIENPQVATKLAFWVRSPRQGAGMRDIGRACFKFLAEANRNSSKKDLFVFNVAENGRWDDLLSLFDTSFKEAAMECWGQAFIEANALAAKWAPRERSKNKKAARAFAKFLGIAPKEYRKLIASLSKTVEQDMCSGNWQNIQYSHVPSQAMRKLRKAFQRRDSERYETYLQDVQNGKKTINASTLWPHQILGECIQWNWGGWDEGPVQELDETSTQLWNNLPNWVNGKSSIVVADTSGSMSGLPIQVSISLAMYTAERLTGIWKNNFITFSSEARFVHLNPELSLARRISSIPSIVENTNLDSVFNLILSAAKNFNIPQSNMPEQIIIISDMQFDEATSGTETNFEAIDRSFREAGFKRPDIVFWNVNGRYCNNSPVTFTEEGTALVSGYSPSILSALSTGDMNPESVMKKALEPFSFSF